MSEGIVTTREEEADALRGAHGQLARMAYSSAYNSHLDPDFKDIIDFDEFCDVFSKIGNWSVKFEERLAELKKKE